MDPMHKTAFIFERKGIVTDVVTAIRNFEVRRA
jgi:hypothetical protein